MGGATLAVPRAGSALRVEFAENTITVSCQGAVLAHMHWVHEYDHIHVDHIRVADHQPRALTLMLAKFRGEFRGSTVWFDALNCNTQMQRLVALLKAESFSQTYSVVI